MATQKGMGDAIYASLRRAILEQALKPGVKLPEDQIGEAFGVSRTGVRGALVRLASEGLVDLRPNRGAAVAAPTLEQAQDAFDIRRFLEREVGRRLSRRMSRDAVEALEAHIREEERALHGGGPRSIRLAGEFHILLAELTGSATLADYVSRSVSRCSLTIAHFARPHSAECGIEEHLRVLNALKAGDGEAVAAIMDQHLGAVQARALLDETDAAPDVGAILSRYAAG
ncbi:MAG: GntR family transcriptional regulator [Rubrimonas sp.]